MAKWMIYGAYGYTGRLVTEEAIQRGHQPVLAGRNAAKLKAMAEELNLEYVAFDLDDVETIVEAIREMEVVYHAAGPFIYTSDPMIRACLRAKTHYVDITGEYPVIENTFSYDNEAQAANITLISGVGFDVIPTDCMAKYVADQLPDADTLEIAFAAIGSVSAGTTQSVLELSSNGGRVRRNGHLRPYPLGKGAREVRFHDKTRTVMPIPWGDVSTGYRSTGIPNITTYMAYPRIAIQAAGLFGEVMPALLSINAVKSLLSNIVKNTVTGPDAETLKSGKSHVWACVRNPAGQTVEAWLRAGEAYMFTAIAGVRVVEQLLDTALSGATTPANAFGADFVLTIPGVERFDTLPS